MKHLWVLLVLLFSASVLAQDPPIKTGIVDKDGKIETTDPASVEFKHHLVLNSLNKHYKGIQSLVYPFKTIVYFYQYLEQDGVNPLAPPKDCPADLSKKLREDKELRKLFQEFMSHKDFESHLLDQVEKEVPRSSNTLERKNKILEFLQNQFPAEKVKK